MTVAELIRHLEAFNPDSPVMTPGLDETGFDDVGKPFIARLVHVVSFMGFRKRVFLAEAKSCEGVYEYDPTAVFDAVIIDF